MINILHANFEFFLSRFNVIVFWRTKRADYQSAAKCPQMADLRVLKKGLESADI
jgi:hypothetical protein